MLKSCARLLKSVILPILQVPLSVNKLSAVHESLSVLGVIFLAISILLSEIESGD